MELYYVFCCLCLFRKGKDLGFHSGGTLTMGNFNLFMRCRPNVWNAIVRFTYDYGYTDRVEE